MSYDEDVEQEDRFSFSYNLDDDNDDDDTDSYIEIAFEPINTNDDYDDKNGEAEEEEDAVEFEFRISFSTLPSFPPLCSPHTDNRISYKRPEIDRSPSMSLSSSSSNSSSTSNLMSSFSTATNRHSESWDGALLKPPPLAPLASGVGDSKRQFYENVKSDNANSGLLHSRKPSKTVTTMNGNITKLFFKFRSLNFQSVLSFVKKSQKIVQQGNNMCINNRTKTGQRDKIQNNNNNNKQLINKYSSRIGDKPGLSSINLNTIKGIVEEAMGVSFGRRKQMKRTSCASSIKASPMHHELVLNEECKMMCTSDSSVQAAISHCKRSFGHY